jgi:hypothetical protein
MTDKELQELADGLRLQASEYSAEIRDEALYELLELTREDLSAGDFRKLLALCQ